MNTNNRKQVDGAGRILIAIVAGARPNFMKVAPIVRALEVVSNCCAYRIVHTGQHYDFEMNEVFFRELGIPEPAVFLGCGGGMQAEQTAKIMMAFEADCVAHRPHLVLVVGDVNSTMAAALVAAKLRIPIAHVEAGLRSGDMTMPEEVNRRVTDILSDLLFVTSPEGLDNLAREGVSVERMHLVGNPMIDTLLAHLGRFDPEPVRERLRIPERYAVATLHRPANVDTPEAAARLVAALRDVGERLPVVFPVHPRGRQMLERVGLLDVSGILVIEPLGYLDFLSLVRGAAVVVTDSGGIQEETTVLDVPCLTLRPNTERPITITHGTNRLVTPEELGMAVDAALRGELARHGDGPPLWDGHAGERIAALLLDEGQPHGASGATGHAPVNQLSRWPPPECPSSSGSAPSSSSRSPTRAARPWERCCGGRSVA